MSVAVRPTSVDQAAQILRLLAGAAAHCGIGLAASDGQSAWQINGETVAFSIEEAAERVQHVPTDKETAAVARWEEKRQADFVRYGYLTTWGRPKIRKWEERSEGRLSVQLEDRRIQTDDRRWGPSIRRTYSDTSRSKLVAQIPRIFAAVAAIAAAKRDNLGVEQRRKLAEERAALDRAAAHQRAVAERGRVDFLRTLLDEHAEYVKLKAYVTSLTQQNIGAETPRVLSLQDWAESQLETLREASSPIP